jgi:hypothetical protein
MFPPLAETGWEVFEVKFVEVNPETKEKICFKERVEGFQNDFSFRSQAETKMRELRAQHKGRWFGVWYNGGRPYKRY